MKRLFLTITFAVLFTGCASTWEGVKEDTSKIYNNTKEAIHDATE